MIEVFVDTSSVQALGDPALFRRANEQIAHRGVDVVRPLAVAEAPARTGRGRSMIAAHVFWTNKGHVGVVSPGRAYYLRILATGTFKKPEGYDIAPFRYAANRRGLQRRASRALGPGRARGAITTLRFLARGGGYAFRRSVRHPGLQPNAWLERAARRSDGPVSSAADDIIHAALNQHELNRAARV